ncbi:ATP-binding protein [Streptosporangium saharense]|uniref:ATP-binding protein n=1 Tax=Streptosporangium saharense TaxID=1706840 RepID=UPI003675B0C0
MIWREVWVRACGRHRRGEPLSRPRIRRWDPADRASAEQLDQIEPAWTVWYGVATRCFYAAAVWPTPDPLVVCAGSAEELCRLMRAAERTAPPRPERPVPLNAGGVSMRQTQGGLRTACWDLSCDPAVIGRARRSVGAALESWGLTRMTDDVVLVTGELLANAITHGEPPIRLSLWLGAGELCVRVSDHGPDQPRHLGLGAEAVHGRGLTIVDALADASGVTPLASPPGKTSWARWRLSSPGS